MEKIIYSDNRRCTDRLLDVREKQRSALVELMKNWKGAELIVENETEYGFGREGIYHIEPYGVSLLYHSGVGHELSILLFGNKEKMGEIEKKILKTVK